MLLLTLIKVSPHISRPRVISNLESIILDLDLSVK